MRPEIIPAKKILKEKITLFQLILKGHSHWEPWSIVIFVSAPGSGAYGFCCCTGTWRCRSWGRRKTLQQPNLGRETQRCFLQKMSNRIENDSSVWGSQPEPAGPDVLHGSCCGAWLKLVQEDFKVQEFIRCIRCIHVRVRTKGEGMCVWIWNVHRNGIRHVFIFVYFRGSGQWLVRSVPELEIDSTHPKRCSLCGLQCIHHVSWCSQCSLRSSEMPNDKMLHPFRISCLSNKALG